MKVTKLKDHEFLMTALLVCKDYIVKCHPYRKDLAPKATRKESYAIETLLSAGSIITCLDQLHFSIEMLTGYRSQNTPEGMNRYDYIVFGIENFYLRLTSVYDRCLRLGNVIFQLGLPQRECKEATIIKNSYVKGTPVAKSLKELDKFTNPFRFQRNTVAHKSSYSDEELHDLGSYYYIVEKDQQLEKYRHMYKRETDNYVAEKKAEFQKHVEKLENLVEEVFNAVHKIFKA